MKVAIQGYQGCFHHIAAEDFFGKDINIIECATFRSTVKALKDKTADVAVMAIENSIAGSILPNYGLLQDQGVRVVGEIYLQIIQNLLVLPDVELEDIREVWSHPMALLQCADYLDDKGWKLMESEDTALAAKQIAEQGLRHAAAIAGELPAKLFGLKVIAPRINTILNNRTRFMVLRRSEDCIEKENPDQINKASMFFSVGHHKGALVSVLNIMEQYDINMTKLQSYPVPSDPFHYLFHLDMEFADVQLYRQALLQMSAASESLTVYGEYLKGGM